MKSGKILLIGGGVPHVYNVSEDTEFLNKKIESLEKNVDSLMKTVESQRRTIANLIKLKK